ncbi:hypothetical protein VPH35_074835 [Triticum aestivum]
MPACSSESEDSEPIHRPARRSLPGTSDGAMATRAVPCVVQTAAAASRAMLACVPGYTPRMSVDMAAAHSWAPYAAVVSALRRLSLTPILEVPNREAARAAIAELYGHATPFDADRRFPTGEVYVCLDRAPFARKMQCIQQYLVKAQAAVGHGEQFIGACSGYAGRIGSALDEVTRVDGGRRGGVAPILYDRAVFESAFLLTWTEP